MRKALVIFVIFSSCTCTKGANTAMKQHN